MKKLWNNITERERLVLLIGGSFVLIFLIFFVIIKPVSDKKEQSFMELQTEKSRYHRIIGLAAIATKNKQISSSTNTNNIPIRVAATETSKKVGVVITRIQPGRNGAVSFWIDAAKTDEIFKWLLSLKETHAKTVQKISIQKNVGEETLRGQFEFEGKVE